MKRFLAAIAALVLATAAGNGLAEKNLYNLSLVKNMNQFRNLTPEAKTKLSQDGLVVTPGPHGGWEQFFHVYDYNYYQGIPNFITSDSILHTYHIFFDFSLRNVEEKKLLAAIETLTAKMLDAANQDLKDAPGGTIKEAAKRNVAYFAIASALLHGRMPTLDEPTAKLAAAEMALIKSESQTKISPINGALTDYSIFIPRGHYTRSDNLKRYFRAMVWYGAMPFVIDLNQDLPAVRAMLVTRALYAKPENVSLWEKVYKPTEFYVGAADDITPAIVWESMSSKAPSFDDLKDESWRKKVVEGILARNPMRIVGENREGKQKPQFRFMGQRYTPDGEVLQSVSKYPDRPFPKGMDLMAALGVEEARRILKEEYKEGESWPDYWKRLDEQAERLAKLSPGDWNQNLYYRWIHLLKKVNEVPAKGAPPMMLTRPWKLKSLVASLGSWAELKHDTILYGKAIAAEGDGGEEAEKIVRGYVEPNPELYAELKNLVAASRQGLADRGLLTDDFKYAAEELETLVGFLENVSRKELNGSPLSRDEYEQIRLYGGRIEYLTVYMMAGPYSTWELVTGPDKSVAVVADIASSMGAVLEEAVGNVWEIYAIVPMPGGLYLTRGSVFSYYEFTQPAQSRLTDERWQEMLEQSKAPPMPKWTGEYIAEWPKPARGK